MSKTTKILGAIAATLGGSTVFGGCGGLGLEGFWEGLFTQGISDNWLIDMVLDWLREDLFS